jgi:hypothetical protein
MENSFGSVPSTSSEDGKPPSIHIKEELGKELPSPDNLKSVRMFECFINDSNN